MPPRPGNRFTRGVRVLVFAALLAAPAATQAAETFRFPQPDFATGYTQPVATTPAPRAAWLEYTDVAVLALALALASWLVLRARSRRALFLLSVFSLLYFGFWRLGCVCPIGAVQNVALGLFDPAYAAPAVVVLFFALPLFAALLFGRVFCAAVCPLGAIQDLVVFRPVRVPPPLAQVLGVLPFVYLGAAVLFAATGSDFVICRYDPFVGFFRLSGSTGLLLFGGALLLLGLFVARPYCRFLCPYAVLLNGLSRLSHRHATITPDECIQCRLCEDTCPFDAIRASTPPELPEPRRPARRRLLLLLVALPLLVALGAGAGIWTRRALARVNAHVRLAEQVRAEDAGATTQTTLRSDAFRATGRPTADLYAEEARHRSAFALGAPLLGGFLGAVIGVKLVLASIYRPRKDYEPDRGQCLSCGRCFASCPREHVRLGKIDGPLPEY